MTEFSYVDSWIVSSIETREHQLKYFRHFVIGKSELRW